MLRRRLVRPSRNPRSASDRRSATRYHVQSQGLRSTRSTAGGSRSPASDSAVPSVERRALRTSKARGPDSVAGRVSAGPRHEWRSTNPALLLRNSRNSAWAANGRDYRRNDDPYGIDGKSVRERARNKVAASSRPCSSMRSVVRRETLLGTSPPVVFMLTSISLLGHGLSAQCLKRTSQHSFRSGR